MGGERERRLGQTPAAFGAHVRIDLGVLEILDAAGRRAHGYRGNPQQRPPDAIEVDDDITSMETIWKRYPQLEVQQGHRRGDHPRSEVRAARTRPLRSRH